MKFDSIACQIDKKNSKKSTFFHLVDATQTQTYKAYMIQLKLTH